MLENLKTLYSDGEKTHPYGVRLATCLLLAGAGYLLSQITGGFPPQIWLLLFSVLPRLQSLWAAQGQGILLPLIGLLLFSSSLLILWSAIILAIGQSIAHLWSTYRQQPVLQPDLQPDLDDDSWLLDQQPAYVRPTTRTQPDRYSEPTQDRQPLFEQQSQPILPTRQFQPALSQQIQPLLSATAPAYNPIPVARAHRSGTPHAYLRLIPDQVEPAQILSEDEEYELKPTQPLLEEQDELDLSQSLDTRPLEDGEENVGISRATTAVNTDWDDAEEQDEEATLRLVIGIGLDPGLVRKDRPNEDSLFAIQGIRTTEEGPVPAGLFVVADGMGGHANGRDASRLAVREVSNIIVPTLLRDESDDNNDEEDEQEFFLNLLRSGVHQANLAIYEQNSNIPHMMGTTITTALVVNTTAYVINVGDSRTYLYRASEGLIQVTRDHSTVARLVEEGEIQRDEIYTHPQRNQIYRCLGEHPTVEMDTFVVPLEPDDILLLCSDGLWEMVRDPIMEKIITSSSHLPAQISNILVQAALNQGGADNISVIAVGIVKTTL